MLPTCEDDGLQIIEDGGPGRDRTDDLFHAMEARSQLRHRPTVGLNLLSPTPEKSSNERRSRESNETRPVFLTKHGTFCVHLRLWAREIVDLAQQSSNHV